MGEAMAALLELGVRDALPALRHDECALTPVADRVFAWIHPRALIPDDEATLSDAFTGWRPCDRCIAIASSGLGHDYAWRDARQHGRSLSDSRRDASSAANGHSLLEDF